MRSTIRQLDVFHNPVRAERADKPYLLSVQHRFLDDLNTRVMAPLVTRRIIHGERRWYPAIRIGREHEALFLDPTDLSALSIRRLGAPVANLERDRYRIFAAIDLVLTGV
jgi:hypothetical protein